MKLIDYLTETEIFKPININKLSKDEIISRIFNSPNLKIGNNVEFLHIPASIDMEGNYWAHGKLIDVKLTSSKKDVEYFRIKLDHDIEPHHKKGDIIDWQPAWDWEDNGGIFGYVK